MSASYIPELSETESSDSDSSSSMNEEIPVVPKAVKKVAAPKNELKLSNKVLSKWPTEDLLELLHRIRNTLTETDRLQFNKQAEKIVWDNIAFNDHSAEDCSRVWFTIQKSIYKYKILQQALSEAEESILRMPRTTSKKQKTRHPEQPKRPLSAYMIFCSDKREEVKQKNAGIRNADAAKLMGEMFRKLSEVDRNIYVKKEKHLRKIYEEELKNFYLKYPQTKQQKPHTVNKPQTPFQMYCERQIKIGSNSENISKNQYKEEWKKMSNDKKIEFIKLAVENEKKVKTEVDHDQKLKYKSVLTKDERILFENLTGKPKKPPHSAYGLFTQVELKKEDIKEMTNSERIKTVAVRWNSCPKEIRDRYKSEVSELKEKYKSDYDVYLKSLSEEQRQAETKTKSKKRKIVGEIDGEAKKRKIEVPEGNNLERPTQPPSAIDLFKETLDNNLNFEESWFHLSKKEKDKFIRKENKMRKIFLADYDVYAKSTLEQKKNIEKAGTSSGLQEQSKNSAASSSSSEDNSSNNGSLNAPNSEESVKIEKKKIEDSSTSSSSSEDSSSSGSSSSSNSEESDSDVDDSFDD